MTVSLPPPPAVGRRILPHIGRVPIPLATGGSSIFTGIAHQTREHARRGGHTTVITSHNRDGHIDGADNLPADYTRYCPREWFTRTERLTDFALGAVGLKRPYHGRIFLPAIELMRDIAPDVVLIHEGHYASASLPYWRKNWPSGRFVLYVHTPLSRSYGPRELRRLLTSADLAVFVSNRTHLSVTARIGELPIPSAVVHNGIDLDVFHPRERGSRESRLRVTFAGQVTPCKGVHLLLAAAAPIKDSIELTVVGSSYHRPGLPLSDYEHALRHQAHDAGLHVSFVPFAAPDCIAGIFRRSDVVCVPSVWEEPFGRVAVEAMACGAAVIASSRGGLPEACGGAAILVDPEDIAAFTNALTSLLDETRLPERQAQSLRRAAQLPWQASYDQLIDALSLIL